MNKRTENRGKIEQSAFAACIIPLLDALGWQGSPQNYVEAMPVGLQEVDGDDLLNIMANLNFEGTTETTNLKRLDLRKLPCLFQHKEKVYTLIRYDRGNYIAFDGNKGAFKQLPRTSLKGTGFFFKGEGSDQLKLLGSQKNWFRHIAMRFNKMLLLGLLLTMLLTLFTFLSPLLVMMIYDKVMISETGDILAYLGSGILLILMGDMGVRFLRSYLLSFTGFRIGNIVGNEVIRRILFLPPEYTETISAGSQISRIKDFDSVQDFLTGPALFALFDLPFIFLLILGMIAIGGSLAFVPLTAVLLFAVLGVISQRLMRHAVENASQSGAKLHEFLINLFTNFQAIKLTGATHIWSDEFKQISAASALDSYMVGKINSIINVTSQCLVSITGLATITVGIFKVFNNQMTAGALMTSVLLVWRILAPLKNGFGVLTQVGRIKKSIAQIDKLMTLKLEAKPLRTMTGNLDLKGFISFSKVSFRYSTESSPTLLGISFNVKPGEILVVTGHNGCGSSTILKLIQGLYRAQAGQVMIDRNNVRQLDPIILRRSIGYVSQGSQIFKGTIADNLRLANPVATEEELEQATKRAAVFEEIKQLEKGMETPIDITKLSQFSPSFSRRLCMSQLFLQKSKLLLIDEPEQRMNKENVEQLVKELEQIKSNHTMILATSNTNFFNIADKILWLEKGRTKLYGPAKEVTQRYFMDKVKQTRGF